MNGWAAAGWHGKLPSVRDFASRRLDPAFVECWDGAMSAGLSALRELAGDSWADLYLSSPAWRFVLGPGFLAPPFGESAWLGVVMPSVDGAGRYYPLTLAAPVRLAGATPQRLGRAWQWLRRLEEAAYRAVQDDWTIEQVEAELAALGPPPGDGQAAGEDEPAPDAGALPERCGAPAAFFGMADPGQSFQDEHMAGTSTWCFEDQEGAMRIFRAAALDEAIRSIWTASPATHE